MYIIPLTWFCLKISNIKIRFGYYQYSKLGRIYVEDLKDLLNG